MAGENLNIQDDQVTQQPLEQDVDTGQQDTDVGQPERTERPLKRGEQRESVRETMKKVLRDAEGDGQGQDQQQRASQRQRRKSSTFDRPEQEQAREQQRAARTDQTEDTQQDEAGQQTQAGPPKGWDKVAKAEWDQLSPAVQAAVIKRENDSYQGVAQLKQQYAELDQAITPHMEVIRKNGYKPAQAVDLMFKWFEYISKNPVQGIPDLVDSFGWDLNRLYSAYQQTTEQQQQQQKEYEQVPPWVKATWENQQAVNQRLTQYEQAMAQQNEANTHRVINDWSKDKPHFNNVRNLMGQLIYSNAVPLTQDGRVDLDAAYEMAVYAHPQVRTQLLNSTRQQDQAARTAVQRQQRNAQQTQANNARSRAVSVGSSAPGNGTQAVGPNGLPKGLSVRESIMAAREQLANEQ